MLPDTSQMDNDYTVARHANRRIPVSHKYPPGENEMRLQALHRGPPQQSTSSVVKPEGRPPASEREIRTGKLCEIKWDYHIVGTRA